MKNFFKFLFLCFMILSFSQNAYALEIKNIKANELLNELTQNKGKIILINFFATWCPPCVDEIPDIVKIRKEYSEDDILILGLSLDDTKDPLPKFIEDMAINYPIYHSAPELAAAYQVSSIPRNIVYNKQLKPVYNEAGNISYDDLKSIIEDNQ